MNVVRKILILGLTLAPVFAGPVHADEHGIKVVASINPVHSLVAGVMRGAGEPDLIIKGNASPHDYSLKPSDATALEQADVVFWIGPDLEVFLTKPLETLAARAEVVALENSPGLTRLKFREDGAGTRPEHSDDHENYHNELQHGDEGNHTELTENDHAHEDQNQHDHDHEHGAFDAHVWLDPNNAKAMVAAIAVALSAANSENAALYRTNARALTKRIDQLSDQIKTILAPVKDRHFIVLHDAYQYFENAFDIHASASVAVNPEQLPGARRLSSIRAEIKKLDAVCVFTEPQFNTNLVATIIDGTAAKSGVLDPLGSGLDKAPNQYSLLMTNMARSIRQCLSPPA